MLKVFHGFEILSICGVLIRIYCISENMSPVFPWAMKPYQYM